MKLAFWPAFFFYFIEYFFLHKRSNNFFLAKTISLYIMPLSIILFFYLYLMLVGHDILFLDIAIFVMAIGFGQLASYAFLTFKRLAPSFEIVSLIFLIILTLAFLLFTYFPPRLFLFKDPVTGGNGIVN